MSFDAAAAVTMAAAPACARALACLRHELLHAAENSVSLNFGPPAPAAYEGRGGGGPRHGPQPLVAPPPAPESGKVTTTLSR